MSRRTRKLLMLPFSIVTSSRVTSATRRSRTDFAAVSTALRAAASHDSLLTPMTWVTRYTLSAMQLPSVGGSGATLAGFSACDGRVVYHLLPQYSSFLNKV